MLLMVISHTSTQDQFDQFEIKQTTLETVSVLVSNLLNLPGCPAASPRSRPEPNTRCDCSEDTPTPGPSWSAPQLGVETQQGHHLLLPLSDHASLTAFTGGDVLLLESEQPSQDLQTAVAVTPPNTTCEVRAQGRGSVTSDATVTEAARACVCVYL